MSQRPHTLFSWLTSPGTRPASPGPSVVFLPPQSYFIFSPQVSRVLFGAILLPLTWRQAVTRRGRSEMGVTTFLCVGKRPPLEKIRTAAEGGPADKRAEGLPT